MSGGGRISVSSTRERLSSGGIASKGAASSIAATSVVTSDGSAGGYVSSNGTGASSGTVWSRVLTRHECFGRR